MKTIYKYPIKFGVSPIVKMPLGAEVLTVKEQLNDAYIWALVDTEEKRFRDRYFQVFGTGHELTNFENIKYIGTFQLDSGNFVGHLFELL